MNEADAINKNRVIEKFRVVKKRNKAAVIMGFLFVVFRDSFSVALAGLNSFCRLG